MFSCAKPWWFRCSVCCIFMISWDVSVWGDDILVLHCWDDDVVGRADTNIILFLWCVFMAWSKKMNWLQCKRVVVNSLIIGILLGIAKIERPTSTSKNLVLSFKTIKWWSLISYFLHKCHFPEPSHFSKHIENFASQFKIWCVRFETFFSDFDIIYNH